MGELVSRCHTHKTVGGFNDKDVLKLKRDTWFKVWQCDKCILSRFIRISSKLYEFGIPVMDTKYEFDTAQLPIQI